jgi:uncharacterized protein (DUF2147 family)
VLNPARFSRNHSPTDQLLATIDPAVMTTRNRKTVIIYPLLLLFLFAITAPLDIWAAEGASPVGLWKNEDAKIEIFKDGEKLDGKIAALNEKYTEDGQKKTDIHNPDPAKRERPLIGLVVMRGISPDGPSKWDGGTAYDPTTGNTYSVSLEYDGGNTLKVRGYLTILGIGRTEVLTRAD